MNPASSTGVAPNAHHCLLSIDDVFKTSLEIERLTLHVPETLNDGTPVTIGQFAEYEAELLGISTGFTLTHGIGVWRSDAGIVYREPVRLYAVDVSTDSDARDRLSSLADRIGRELAQRAVYVTASPIDQELVLAGVGL